MVKLYTTKIPKYEVHEELKINDIVFQGGTKYTNRKGNKELEWEINMNKDEYTTADSKMK